MQKIAEKYMVCYGASDGQGNPAVDKKQTKQKAH